MLRCLDNHDQRRAITEFGNKASAAAMAINFTMDGIPFVYNAQEIGDPNPLSLNVIYPIRWEPGRTATMKVGNTVIYRGGYHGQNLPEYRKLIGVRAANRVFAEGEQIWVGNSGEDRIVSYLRQLGDEEALIAVNLSNRPWKGTLELPADGWVVLDLLAGAPLATPPGSRTELSLGSFEYRILARSRAR